jgi:AcrR family transcriptional regulator
MATATVKAPTRQRLIDVAVRLFTQHSFAGTSLQMIANELGITKAAVYHYFRTREELLLAVVEPVLDQLRTIVETAEAQRTRTARAENVLTGFIDIAVRHRGLIFVLASDPGVIDMLRAQQNYGDLINRQLKLLADVDPGPAGPISAAVVLAGVAGAVGPALVDVDENVLRQQLLDVSRRALGLRAPRRPAGTDAK